MRFYGRELARVHDDGFGDFGRAAAAFVIERLARQGVPPGPVVELGCGSGITCAALGAAGRDVIGIDLAESMLALARARAPHAAFVRGSVWDTPLPPCAAVTAIGEVLNYSADPRASRERLPTLFSRIHDALAPGGIFVLDFATPGRGLAGPARSWDQGDGWLVAHQALEDPAAKVLERRIVTYVRTGASWSRHDELHLLQLYAPDEVRAALEGAGFRAEAIDAYGDFSFWEGYAGFVGSRDAR